MLLCFFKPAMAKKLTPKGVKVLKILHLFFAMLWICGAVCLTLVIFIADPQTGGEAFMKARIIQIIDDWSIIPGALGCLLTGLIYSIWTNWGFFKHTWITAKWIMTVVQILFGTFVLGPWVNGNVEITNTLRADALADPIFLHNIQMTKIWGTTQMSLLLLYIIVSVWKPWKSSKKSK